MKTYIIIVAGMIVAGAANVAWNAARTTNEAESALASLAQKRLDCEGAIQRTEARIAAGQAKGGTDRVAGTNSPATKAAPTKEPPPAGSLQAFIKSGQTFPARMRAERKDPAYAGAAQLWNQAYYRARWEMTWQPFFKSLGLLADEREKFLSVRLEYAAKLVELQSLIYDGTLKASDPGVKQFREKANAEQQAALTDLLGEAGMREFTEYARAEPARALVTAIAGAAAMAGVPIAASQLEQLVRAVANASGAYQQGRDVSAGDIDWDAVDAEARMFLSKPQWAAMTTLLVPSYPDGLLGTRFDTRVWLKAQAAQADAASKMPHQ